MSDTNVGDEHISGGPTKRFFVSMLTRDIALKDAILDLLDNSVDGAMRQLEGRVGGESPYEGFWAKIQVSHESFEIVDNCGGISPDVAEMAFMLGRPDVERDANLPTVGMYGIGMKRAIFKLGKSATVSTRSEKGEFTVTYSPEWLDETNDDWQLPIERKSHRIEGNGTRITVDSLADGIKKQFHDISSFEASLREEISRHYGYIIRKGFAVYIGETKVSPVTLEVRSSDDLDNGIAPFIYSGQYEDVNIHVVIGFYRPPPKAVEIDDEFEGSKRSDEAGITIICNDRVVVYKDRSRVTGWGEQTVPKYHNQFSSISGLVVFTSNVASHLPLTTTKRGIDQDSASYWLARDQIIRGIKIFTDFTNKWKGREEETSELFEHAPRVSALDLEASAAQKMTPVRGDDAGGKQFIPKLPLPRVDDPVRRISFSRTVSDIKKVSRELFDDASRPAAEVGGEAFDRVLREAQKNER